MHIQGVIGRTQNVVVVIGIYLYPLYPGNGYNGRHRKLRDIAMHDELIKRCKDMNSRLLEGCGCERTMKEDMTTP